jgi:DNA-binding CsgD family transcriptional regulator
LLEETSAAVGEGDGRLRLLLEGAVLAAGQLDAKLGQDLAPRLERMRRSLAGDRAAPANALATTAVWTAMINRPAGEAAALAEQALRVEAAERDELALAAPSFFHACGALLAAEHYERVAALYDEAIAAAQADGAAVTLALGHSWRSLLFLRMGVVLEAEGEAELAARIHEAPLTRLFQPLAAAVRVEALIERGELDRAQEIGERSTVDLEAARSLYSAFLRFAIGRLRCAQGRYSDAAALLEEAGRLLTAMGVASPSILSWRSSAAIARLMSGDASEARALAREELVLAERFGAPRALVVAARTCGLIEAPGGDLRHLRRAVEVSADSPARLEHARSRVELGAALRRSGERREARDQLRPGLDLAASLGATALRDRALTELRAAGGRPRRIAVSGTDSLTASERRVAELAADGLTNRQIAQALYVTPRTVEGHLTQVYRKLDVPGRETLKAALAPPAPAAGRD